MDHFCSNSLVLNNNLVIVSTLFKNINLNVTPITILFVQYLLLIYESSY